MSPEVLAAMKRLSDDLPKVGEPEFQFSTVSAADLRTVLAALDEQVPEPMIDGWPLYSMLPPPASKQIPIEPEHLWQNNTERLDTSRCWLEGDGGVPMPEPVGAVIPEGSTEYADCVTLGQCRAYGDARALAAMVRQVLEPLSDEQIKAVASLMYTIDTTIHNEETWFLRGARFAEKHHGINAA